MPTLDNHSSVITVKSQAARSRRLLLTTLLLLAAILFPFEASAANTCVMVTVLPPATTNWSDSTRWTFCGGGYPGQSGSGDTANILSLFGTTINVDVPLNSVALHIDGSIPVQIASGATLSLESSSTATSNNSFTVGSGGTMGTASGANITSFQGAVHVNGGTFNSAGTIALTGGTFTYSGGSLTGSGTISITNSGIFDGALGAMPISATTINTSGFLSYTSATNAVTLSSGANINVLSGGTFSVATDAAFNGTSTEALKINSGGSMQKTAGTGINVISCFVKNDGTVDASTGGSGGFGFSGDGAHTGSFITGSSQPIVFAGNNSFGAGTSFGGGSPIKIAAGTQTFNATVNAGGGLKWAGGTIAGTGPLNVLSSMLFDGSLSAMTLTGVMKSTAAITYAPSNINNLLTINGASAVFETTTPGSLAIAGDYDILASPAGAGKLRISGSANVNKTGGAAGSSIFAYVDNQSSTLANSAAGPLNIAGGGQSTGSVSVPGGSNIINFTGGTFDSSGVFSGGGIINVGGGTLNVNTATTFSGAPTLNVSGGTLGGSGVVTITGSSTWSGGTITGSNSLTITSPGLLTVTGSAGPMTLDGRTLTNNNTLLYSSGTNNLTLKNNASIVNGGAFTAAGSGTISTDGSAVSIANNSQFTKTLPGLFIIETAFNNAGSGVAVNGGALDIDATGTSSAPWTMAAGTEVWFPTPFAGTYTWASGTSFSGGKVTIDGSGTVATSFPMTVNNTNLEVNGGTFSTPSTFTVTTPGTLKWKGGTLAGAGHTVISASTTFDMTTESSPRNVSAHTIDNAGNATLVATTQPLSFINATFSNTGSLDIQSDGAMLNTAGSNAFNNSGNVKKTAGGSGFRFDVPYNQTVGTTDANSSTPGSAIIFGGGGTLLGGTLKASQATNSVDFFSGLYALNGVTLNAGAPGPIRMTGAAASLSLNVPTSITNFIHNSGTVFVALTLTVSSGGTYTWNGDTISGGVGDLIIASGGTLDVAGAINTNLVLNNLAISNFGTITYHPVAGGLSNQLRMQGFASIVNQSGGILDMTDGSNILQIGGATSIVNNGTIRKLTATSSSIAPAITNNVSGLIKATSGTISLLTGTSNGTLDAGPTGAINFGSGATFTITGGTWGGSGGGFWVNGGDVTISAPFSLTGLALNSGQIDGSNTLTLTGANAWGGGIMNGFGITTNNGTLTMPNNQNTFLTNRTFNNNGTLNYQTGSFGLRIAGSFNNSGLFDLQGDGPLTTNTFSPATFHNNVGGTLQKWVVRRICG